MNQSFTSIPFKTETAHGLTSVNGMAKFSGAGIVLEFEAKLFGLISEGVKEARLQISEILDIKFKKGIFKRGAKIEVRTTSLAAMAGIPNEQGKLTLKINKDDFERGRNAVAQLQRDMGTTAAQLPPTHTPVSVLFDESEEETKELKN